MNAEELSEAVDELDTRLERLRVLYEQYFQGIEKIPPLIVQKDVDRRIWILRREKIRNTGTRFKFQQIIQRYNTFGAYWMRIMREIENGTYKRDVLRAKKKFGVDVVHPNAAPQPQAPPESLPPPSHELSLDDIEEESTFDHDDLGLGPSKAPPPRAPANAAPPARPPLPGSAVPPARPPLPGSAVPPARPLTPAPAARKIDPAAAQTTKQILSAPLGADDDLDDMLDMALGPAARTAPKPAPAPAPARAPAPAPAPARAPAPAPAPARAAQPAARPQPMAANASNPGSEEYRRVYAAYVEARRKNGESTAGLTYDSLAKSLKDTTEKLKSKAGGKAIDFEVATKDGRTILKPVVK